MPTRRSTRDSRKASPAILPAGQTALDKALAHPITLDNGEVVTWLDHLMALLVGRAEQSKDYMRMLLGELRRSDRIARDAAALAEAMLAEEMADRENAEINAEDGNADECASGGTGA